MPVSEHVDIIVSTNLDVVFCGVGEIQAIVVEKHGTVPHVGVAIEIMRGIAKATREIPDSQQLLFSFFETAMDPLLKLLDMFTVDENAVCSILKLAAEVVEANIVFLEVSAAQTLLKV